MPRPSRPTWNPLTITISKEVADALRVKAAAHSEDMGTLADRILRSALQGVLDQLPGIRAPLLAASAEPPQAPGAGESQSPNLEERFFEVAMKLVKETTGQEKFISDMVKFFSTVQQHGDRAIPTLHTMAAEVQTWMKERRIPKDRQFDIFGVLDFDGKQLSKATEEAGIDVGDLLYGTTP